MQIDGFTRTRGAIPTCNAIPQDQAHPANRTGTHRLGFARTAPVLKRPAGLPLLVAIVAARLGDAIPLRVAQPMPYVAARVNRQAGQPVIDFGADVSATTPAGFADPASLPFAIGIRERDQWLHCMRRALADSELDQTQRDRLLQAFAATADHMRNKAEHEADGRLRLFPGG